jgi:hypothetical protein
MKPRCLGLLLFWARYSGSGTDVATTQCKLTSSATIQVEYEMGERGVSVATFSVPRIADGDHNN